MTRHFFERMQCTTNLMLKLVKTPNVKHFTPCKLSLDAHKKCNKSHSDVKFAFYKFCLITIIIGHGILISHLFYCIFSRTTTQVKFPTR